MIYNCTRVRTRLHVATHQGSRSAGSKAVEEQLETTGTRTTCCAHESWTKLRELNAGLENENLSCVSDHHLRSGKADLWAITIYFRK